MHDLDAVTDQLRTFYWRTRRRLDRLLREQGTSLARTTLLKFVEQEGPVRSTDIAETFGQTPRTVTEAIDALERDGLIRRDPDPDDRRAKRISITPEGLTAIGSAAPKRRAVMEDVFRALEPDEVATLARLLEKLNRRLGGPGASAGCGGNAAAPYAREALATAADPPAHD